MVGRYPGGLSLILASIALVVQLCLHVIIIKHHAKRKKYKRTNIIVCHIALLFNACYIVWILWLSVYSVTTTNFNVIYCAYYFFSGGWLMMARISMYTFFIIRVYKIFKNSSYSYSKNHIIMIITLLVISWFAACGGILYFVIDTTNTIIHSAASNYSDIIVFEDCSASLGKNSNIFVKQSSFSVVFLEIISSIIVLRLYLSKLVRLAIIYNEINIEQQSQIELVTPYRISSISLSNDSKTVCCKEDVVFFKVAMRMTNTLIFAVSTTAINILFNGVGQYFMVIDCACNTLAIYLSFTFGDGLYEYLCCNCCQNCCYAFCVRLCYCCCAPKKAPEFIIQIEVDSKEPVTPTSDLEIQNVTI